MDAPTPTVIGRFFGVTNYPVARNLRRLFAIGANLELVALLAASCPKFAC